MAVNFPSHVLDERVHSVRPVFTDHVVVLLDLFLAVILNQAGLSELWLN